VQHSLSPMDVDTGGDGTTMELEFRRAPVNIAQIPKFNELDMCAVFHWRTPVPLYAALPPSSLGCPGGTLSVRARYTSKSSPRRTPT
jgi:hypothetical protein